MEVKAIRLILSTSVTAYPKVARILCAAALVLLALYVTTVLLSYQAKRADQARRVDQSQRATATNTMTTP